MTWKSSSTSTTVVGQRGQLGHQPGHELVLVAEAGHQLGQRVLGGHDARCRAQRGDDVGPERARLVVALGRARPTPPDRASVTDAQWAAARVLPQPAPALTTVSGPPGALVEQAIDQRDARRT